MTGCFRSDNSREPSCQMLLTDLPPEILTSIVSYATASAPTRQKRRKELLTLGRTCKALSRVCLRQIYGKLAYEISLKGLKLLSTLSKKDSGVRYASMVRALAVRERESGIQRRPINSRQEASTEVSLSITNATGNTAAAPVAMSTRAKKMAVDSILLEEKRISDLMKLVENTVIELKYETNLMPKDDLAFSRIQNLQSLSITAQPMYPDSMDRESMLQVALFTLPLPHEIFLPAFSAWQHLSQLDLWRCSLESFTYELISNTAKPSFRIQRLGLEECAISGKALDWLLHSTLQAESLKNLQLSFLTDPETDATKRCLPLTVQNVIRAAGPHLEEIKLEIDDGELDVPPPSDSAAEDDTTTNASQSVLQYLGRLKNLHLSGRSVTGLHWTAIPEQTLQSLNALALYFTPSLAPQLVIESLRALDPLKTKLKHISLRGSEDFKRRNLRELLHPEALHEKSEWLWTKEEFVTFVSWAQSRDIQYIADRTIVVGDGDEDEASSSADEYEEVDEAGDFFVTQEQWEMEKAIEAEELERTWESGSEY